MIDIKANIIPSVSLGGVILGEHIGRYEYLLDKHVVKYVQDAIFSVKYKFPDYHLSISVDVRNGNIYKITAHSGYIGGMNGVFIGDPIIKIPKSFVYDDCDEGYMDKNMDGVIIQTDIDDPLPEELASAKVGVIAVFLPSAFTLSSECSNREIV
ncbi:hypothetical protein [Pectobacterium wasabiae]|uniref:Uncharacterized protein n=1 Tax=Pectobacterium wasabiae TaxID=55208 RepID=A0AAW3EIX9_9GAMM|nr:hypothetical protein [Pectobacterium wasabiae]AOR64140.1 hypothetical protein A7983_12885 [Pectobacterium wasabiae CFBP 3304]EJS94539.1 Hypothetical protein Y17_2594 [Pectobacterium wasabiae CFBP 3304]KFX08759.1 hypothetical protein JV38_08530 [Pectobacterium wasabiae]KGA28786.1 hypothetical protein KU73_12250 [Pectobacterium wasabiae]